MKPSSLLILFLLSLFYSCANPDQNNHSWRQSINEIIKNKEAIIGISIIGNQGKDTLSINGDRPFPMQSVFKLPIAMAILNEVDQGNLSLDQKVEIHQDWLPGEGLWNPLGKDYPNGGSLTIQQLIQYSVAQSDNTACDVLIKLLGTPKNVEQYIHGLGVKDIQITYNEKDMQKDWNNMFENWTTPKAASRILKKSYNPSNQLYSQRSYDLLWNTLQETSTGPKQIKGLLPIGTVVAHKTGSSGVQAATGIIGAMNDIGIVLLPNNDYFIISVFISESKEDIETNENLIAEISKVTYDYFTQTK